MPSFVENKRFSKTIIVRCDCGCGQLEITQFDDGYAFLGYSSRQSSSPIKSAIYDRLKMIWCAITGKEYLLYDVIIPSEKIAELKSAISQLEVKNNFAKDLPEDIYGKNGREIDL